MILWDADGVLFETFDAEGKFRWSAQIAADLGVEPACLHDIFHGGWEDVLRGLLPTEQHIEAVLDRHGASVSAETFVDYWLEHDAFVNEALLPMLSPVNSCIATNQDPLRTGRIERLFSGRVRNIYASSRMGVMKPEPVFFSMIERDLGLPASALCLVDDNAENVEAARSRGWRGHAYQGVDALRAFLKTK